MPQLMLTTVSGESMPITLKPDENTLGRGPKNDIVIDSPQASRVHAVITVEPAFVTIRDLGSRNGTFVNDHRIESQLLVHDDSIKLGSYEMRFVSGDQEFSHVEAERVSTEPRLLLHVDLELEDDPTSPEPPTTRPGKP
ncbi:FHA domain-containing protein [Variovorax sp. Sphag1AA]|uniref:FHA domain-containing protein n=1 Tax=Variovorax sp. Sphag1AA TaxID=2587027 RepID=UPI00161977CD|nr:FHA domain-containing protein [Variovorax sp. Sphag1AA]MBB3177280.1 pSer/pThr/pTyr-binding forkhead associated (FHA) protein [Variovorax sp. Sphag1AA]